MVLEHVIGDLPNVTQGLPVGWNIANLMVEAIQGQFTGNPYIRPATEYAPDSIAPSATYSNPSMPSVSSPVSFEVQYTDNKHIATSSIDSTDIRVTGPNGYSQLATLVAVDDNSDGTPRTATYQFVSPGGEWTSNNNGTYEIWMVTDEVSDTSENYVAAGLLGTFSISLDNAAPTAFIDEILPESVLPPSGTVSFSGHGIDTDGEITAYEWRSDLEGYLSDQSSFSYFANDLEVGVHTISFKVRDNDSVWSDWATRTRTLTVENAPPTATWGDLPSSAVVAGSSLVITLGGHDNDENQHRIENGELRLGGSVIATPGTGSFSFTAPFQPGDHALQWRVQDDEGTWSAPISVTLTVVPDPPPTVESMVLGDGSSQRSVILSLKVTFSEDVSASLTMDRLVLDNLTTGETIAPVDMARSYSPGTDTAEWTFPGLPDEKLAEGNYTGTLLAAGIIDQAGNAMAEDSQFDFHVFAGDATGDAKINESDLLMVRRNYLKPPGLDRDDSADVNGDGAVNAFDLLLVRQNYLEVLEVPFEILVSDTEVTVPEGDTAQFTVSISAEPRGTITVTTARIDGDEDLSVDSGTTLTFDNTNWNIPQPVTLAAAEDADTIDGTAEFTVSANGATIQPVVNATEDDNDGTVPANFTDDFEDGVIDTVLWAYDGARRGWSGDPGGGSWSYSHDESGGRLEMRVDGPASGLTYGAEAWARTTYDYNDGLGHTVNFEWDADVVEYHYNHYLIQITDGHIPEVDDLHWSTREVEGTIDLLWSETPESGELRRGAYLRSTDELVPEGSPETWSIMIDPAGTARLYDGPDGTGTLLREEPLPTDQPWYVRLMVSDGTSSGFPAGDTRLNLYSFSSVTTFGAVPGGASLKNADVAAPQQVLESEERNAIAGVAPQTLVVANAAEPERKQTVPASGSVSVRTISGLAAVPALPEPVLIAASSVSPKASMVKPTASAGSVAGPAQAGVAMAALGTEVPSASESPTSERIVEAADFVFSRTPIGIMWSGFDPSRWSGIRRPIASPLTTSSGGPLAAQNRATVAESPVTRLVNATKDVTEMLRHPTEDSHSFQLDWVARRSRPRWRSVIDQALASEESWSGIDELVENLAEMQHGIRRRIVVSEVSENW